MIKVYTKPSCMQCEMTKMWLGQNKIPFESVEATNDSETLNYIREMGYTQLPIVELQDGTTWSGFQPDKLELLKG